MERDLIYAENRRLNDLIDQWHDGDGRLDLPTYLGMSADEYKYFVSDTFDYCKMRVRREERRQKAAEQALAVMSRVVKNLPLCQRVLRVLDIPLEEVEAIFGHAGASSERFQG